MRRVIVCYRHPVHNTGWDIYCNYCILQYPLFCASTYEGTTLQKCIVLEQQEKNLLERTHPCICNCDNLYYRSSRSCVSCVAKKMVFEGRFGCWPCPATIRIKTAKRCKMGKKCILRQSTRNQRLDSTARKEMISGSRDLVQMWKN